MQINLSGHHLDITDGIRSAVNSKFAKIESHYPDISSLSVALTVERQEQRVDLTTQYLGATVAVHAAQGDLYAAIADAARKLDAALAKRKGALGAHRNAKPQLDDEPQMEDSEPLAAEG
ncbi:ribosome hibernation-promoting factor, HPF/YfiA family [Marinimicrobium sp. ABcell2]|uniref:ribosome hibernation-promoting factor, HPF/YfiA family n=1 Tax=Marinimicrobium sp. ABcell2 TaxID=3069751 RepID=UPI0027B6610F|nr:ribosome-associated translation inhibitor RaiA [Marinimicrobium sp. ABcell2]MDQ2077618.1 ribosome-associated translation inhibitor RaiA [Marinimicrobium sp. ABcell2]